MIDVDSGQAATLAAIVDAGTFDAAAQRLHLTPSAVSQRVRAIETAVGRPVLRRTKPVTLTEAGEAIVRFARQLALLDADLAAELGAAAELPQLTVVINGDSLTTWALPALATVTDRVRLELLREDQDHSAALLREGRAVGAVTSQAQPVAGCSARRIGTMRYRPMCTAEFAARWFPDGPTADALARAPMLCYDRKDDLQDRFVAKITRRAVDPPRQYVPASHEFSRAITLGIGWGVVSPQEMATADLQTLITVDARTVAVPLYWQQWKIGSAALSLVADAIWTGSADLR